MVSKSLNNSNQRNQYDICKKFTTYWVVLIVWQNVFKSQTRGAADALLKICLLGYLTFSFLKISTRTSSKNLLLWLLFVVSQLITLFLYDMDEISLGTIVYYVYPSLMLFLVYCVGSRFSVTKSQIDKMNNAILAVLLCSILYTFVFEPQQYIAALTARNTGYGHELTSFFVSMHEYAQYLSYGIVICLNRIGEQKYGKTKYIILLILLSITLMCTFSRTAIVGCLAYLLIYSFMGYRTKMGKTIFIVLLLSTLVIIFTPSLAQYAFKVVWKSGHSSSRESLYAYAIEYYKNGTLLNQLFGYGIAETRMHFNSQIGYSSVHNGLLQVLLYYGLIGLLFLVALYLQQTVEILHFFKINRSVALFSLGMLAFSFLSMLPNTMIVFTSSIECYFMTIMMIIVPKYQRNAIMTGGYDP